MTNEAASDAAAVALRTHKWRPDQPTWPTEHGAHLYEDSCAICRPDLDDGYRRIVDVVAPIIAAQVRAETLRETSPTPRLPLRPGRPPMADDDTTGDVMSEGMAGCNGLCGTASDVSVIVPGDPVDYPHPSCPEHADPAPTAVDATKGNADEK